MEVAVGGFFNGKEFIRPVNINFEHKRLFPGNIGPSTGEMGTLMLWIHKSRIFELTLEKIKQNLAASGYIGYIDVNCIANGTWHISARVHIKVRISHTVYPHGRNYQQMG